MEDIKIWALDGVNAELLQTASRMDTEHEFEDILVANPSMLLDGLTLVGRQTPTEGGPLDLLGVDGNGRLVVFELKRGALSRDAVAQIIDYASYLDGMDTTELASYISENPGALDVDEIGNFEDWYNQNPNFGELESLKPLRLFLVGLGVDDRTERMVRFLAENSGLDISLLTFRGFVYEGKTLLAKQVEVEGDEDRAASARGGYIGRDERWRRLGALIMDSEVSELFDDVRNMFRRHWRESRERPGRKGVTIALPVYVDSRRTYPAYGRIDIEGSQVRVTLRRRAIDLCKDEFMQIIDEIRYETYPRNRQPLEGATIEVGFLLTADEWDAHKGSLTGLVKSIYEAWKDSDSEDAG